MERRDTLRQEIYQKVDAFIADSTTRELDTRTVMRYLDARPSRANRISWADEVEIAREIRDADLFPVPADASDEEKARGELTALEVSVLMIIPIQHLRPRPSRLELQQFRGLVKKFLLKPDNEDKKASTVASSARTKSVKRKRGETDDDEYHPKAKVSRKAKEVDKCLQRDGYQCCVSGSREPCKCHIVPFAFNSTKENLYYVRDKVATYLRWFGLSKEIGLLIAGGVGCTDRSWNMLCMDPKLHIYWSKAYFAIKCAGITPDKGDQWRIHLEFHWMPMRINQDPDRPMPLGKARDQHAEVEPGDVDEEPEDEPEKKKSAAFWKGRARSFSRKLRRGQKPGAKDHAEGSAGATTQAEDAEAIELIKSTSTATVTTMSDEDDTEVMGFINGPDLFYGDPEVPSPKVMEGDQSTVSMAIDRTHRHVLSGHEFSIVMDRGDAEKMKAMVDFQWALIHIAAMSGATGWPKFAKHDDDDDEFPQVEARVRTWLDETNDALERVASGDGSE